MRPRTMCRGRTLGERWRVIRYTHPIYWFFQWNDRPRVSGLTSSWCFLALCKTATGELIGPRSNDRAHRNFGTKRFGADSKFCDAQVPQPSKPGAPWPRIAALLTGCVVALTSAAPAIAAAAQLAAPSSGQQAGPLIQPIVRGLSQQLSLVAAWLAQTTAPLGQVRFSRLADQCITIVAKQWPSVMDQCVCVLPSAALHALEASQPVSTRWPGSSLP